MLPCDHFLFNFSVPSFWNFLQSVAGHILLSSLFCFGFLLYFWWFFPLLCPKLSSCILNLRLFRLVLLNLFHISHSTCSGNIVVAPSMCNHSSRSWAISVKKMNRNPCANRPYFLDRDRTKTMGRTVHIKWQVLRKIKVEKGICSHQSGEGWNFSQGGEERLHWKGWREW